MGLSLSDTEYLYRSRGTLYARTYAACGLLARSILSAGPPANPPSARQAWAAAMRDNPDATAFGIYKAVITDASIQALATDGLLSGAAPTDADLNALVGAIVTAFMGA